MQQNSIWINKFKSAVLTKDAEKIKLLLETFPSFENTYIDAKKEVLLYLEKSKEILSDINKKISTNMAQIRLKQKFNKTLTKKNKTFINHYI